MVQKLRSFAQEVLVNTCYNTDDKDFLANQYQSVYALIDSLYKISPDSLESALKDWENTSIIPTVEEIGIEHMHNIGTSARMCLDYLQSQSKLSQGNNRNDQEVLLRVEQYLNLLKHQARKASNQYHLAQSGKRAIDQEEFDNEIRQRITAFSEDYQKQVEQANKSLDEKLKELDKKVIEFTELEKKLNNIANQAKADAEAAKTDAQAANTATQTANTAAQNATKAANIAKDTAQNMLPNMLSVLGILVGIVVAIVGCYLSILLGEHNADIQTAAELSRPFEFARYLVMGHTTTIVVFLLMYLISRISKHTLSCSCSIFDPIVGYEEPQVHDCTKCTKKCGIAVRFIRRYPYLFGINAVCCIGYAMLALWQFINVYFRDIFDSRIISLGFWRSLLAALGVSILAMAAILIVVAFYVLGYRAIKWLLSKTRPQ